MHIFAKYCIHSFYTQSGFSKESMHQNITTLQQMVHGNARIHRMHSWQCTSSQLTHMGTGMARQQQREEKVPPIKFQQSRISLIWCTMSCYTMIFHHSLLSYYVCNIFPRRKSSKRFMDWIENPFVASMEKWQVYMYNVYARYRCDSGADWLAGSLSEWLGEYGSADDFIYAYAVCNV